MKNQSEKVISSSRCSPDDHEKSKSKLLHHTNNKSLSLITISIVSICAFFFYWIGSDMPLHIHADEYSKLRQIIDGDRNFNHPLFMMHHLEILRIVLGIPDIQQLANAARFLTGLYGAITILVVYFLARQALNAFPAIVAATLAGLTPLMGTHAQFIKEDIFAAPLLMLALIIVLRWGRVPSRNKALILGIIVGLAVSAKLSSLIIVIPVVYTFIVVGRSQDRSYLASLGLVALSALLVFSIIQIPALLDHERWLASFEREAGSAITGHYLYLWPIQTKLIFHLKYSLLKGMGWPALTMGLFGLIYVIGRWKNTALPLRVLTVFALSWYGIHELLPLKIYHGGMRYMLPLVPVLAILSILFLQVCISYISSEISASGSNKLFTALVIALLAVTLFMSYPLVIRNNIDTRSYVTKIFLDKLPGKVVIEPYSTLKDGNVGAPYGNNEKKYFSSDFALVSSILYDDFFLGTTYIGQPDFVYEIGSNYRSLFSLPYIQVSNNKFSYSYHNPVIRIVCLSDKAAQWAKNLDLNSLDHKYDIDLKLINDGTMPSSSAHFGSSTGSMNKD